jgi:ubiquinone/menaquinone biosynthesis C-methylase UbiE
LKRTLWKRWYQFLARGYPQGDWTFMNYGFAELDSRAPELHLEAADEPNRYFIQLYHQVVGSVDLRGLDVLEVGSGRGGGCSYIARYLQPRSTLGIDFSEKAVALSQKLHAVPHLSFEQGDAEALPCKDGVFDAVVNVESSHCYGSMERFLGEVSRVLRPGGYFLWADMRPRGQRDAVHGQFQRAGLALRQEADITANVLLALDRINDRKRETIRRHVSKYLLRWFEDFAGVRGTRVYEALRAGEVQYWRCTLQKPAAS